MIKKAYVKAEITGVKLDPDQAILQACKVGGAYWCTGAGTCSVDGTDYLCPMEVRGKQESCNGVEGAVMQAHGS